MLDWSTRGGGVAVYTDSSGKHSCHQLTLTHSVREGEREGESVLNSSTLLTTS